MGELLLVVEGEEEEEGEEDEENTHRERIGRKAEFAPSGSKLSSTTTPSAPK